ncbi:MAG: hypothetical protein Q7U28_07220 [Aquabacterium sp.]|nr:hypothetical protein [Aquabacterium sp.]
MPQEYRNLPNLSHETLTNALIAGGVAAAILLGGIVYFLWRERGNSGKSKGTRVRARRSNKRVYVIDMSWLFGVATGPGIKEP